MKNTNLLVVLLFLIVPIQILSQSYIRLNQLGYLPFIENTAVLMYNGEKNVVSFSLHDALTDQLIFSSKDIISYPGAGNFKKFFRLNFSNFENEGAYYLKCGEIRSSNFKISNDVYNGTADYLLNYMRQQRCGYNPFLKDSCHTDDGFIIYHPTLDSTHIDVTGGWHDASDYLQYTTTSANAVFQMLFAYQQNPNSFSDNYDAEGKNVSNGIPDILDEAKWGLDWLVKMNPQKDMMFNQIADDRDHQQFRLPTLDSVNYGKDFQRPVYYCTGLPQGVMKHKNRADGIASTAGKFASSFALGSELLKDYYPDFSEKIFLKAEEAYKFGKANPGVCQTAPCRAPYFYEEDNFTDDMELAAAQLYQITKNKTYLNEAAEFGMREMITPWMGADTANHYQWYPFFNAGHFLIASDSNDYASQFTDYLYEGLNKIYERGKQSPFKIGIPFIWCSNNLISAALTQCRLYNNLTGDKTFLEMEAALRDWLFGCNPWGTSMIVGLPENGDTPSDPHSAFTHLYNYKINGGLVDGPVYRTIFEKLIGLYLHEEDEYAEFQMPDVVYHDDVGDYSTNEPTMDGTASLTFYLSALENLANRNHQTDNIQIMHGAIIRFDNTEKNIYLCFTGHEFADGGELISNTLNELDVKANFFFTGDFYRNNSFKTLIEELKSNNHYLGAHSDKHLLYADWNKRDSLLITKNTFRMDLKNNYKEMKKFGIEKNDALFFMPPFEWYNDSISVWTKELGLTLINYSPGTITFTDYTFPSMGKSYFSTEKIYNQLFEYEKSESEGLNGFILLLHIGSDNERTDKFYFRLKELIMKLRKLGYSFKSFGEE